MKILPLLGVAALLCPSVLMAQTADKENEFAISMQVRTRGEYRNGVLNPRSEGDDPAWFVNERARLSMDYRRSGLSMRMSAQHVGVWGQDPQIDKNGRFILHEAWARIASADGLFAQVGRQPLVYDDERILGGLDWNVAGRYHDALKLGYQGKQNQLHLIFAFNQNDEKVKGGTYYNSSTGQPYKSMQTAWYHYAAADAPFDASLLFMNLGWETGTSTQARTHYLQTMGTYLKYRPEDVLLTGAFYYQSGRSKANKSVSAFMWSITADWMVSRDWTITLGSDYLSGNDGKGDKDKAFDPLYGTHHKFYGAMDYFYASSWLSGVNSPGLWDNRIGATWKASPKIAVQGHYHYFSAAQKPADDLKRNLGSEIDLQADFALMKDVKLTVGYSTMLPTKTMDYVKGGSHKAWQDWGWVSLNINPSVFISKW